MKLDQAILKLQSCSFTSDQYDSLQSNINLLKSTQKSLENIIKIQGETTNSLQQVLVFESKFLSLEELMFNDIPQLNNQSMNILKDNSIVHSTEKSHESPSSDHLKGDQPYENCKTICTPPESSSNSIINIPDQPVSNADLLPEIPVNLQDNVPILPVSNK